MFSVLALIVAITAVACSSGAGGDQPATGRDRVGDTQAPEFSGLESVSPASSTSLQLSWQAATDNVTADADIKYRICYSTAAGECSASFESSAEATGTGHTVTGLTAGNTYYFIVRAVDGAGNTDNNTVEKASALSGWFTFFGTTDADDTNPVVYAAADGSVYLAAKVNNHTSTSYQIGDGSTAPLRAHPCSTTACDGYFKTLLARFNKSGQLQWYTFIGAAGNVWYQPVGITESDGNIAVLMNAEAALSAEEGTPLEAYHGSGDALVAVFNNSGAIEWHRFIGAASTEQTGKALLSDADGNLFITGYSKGSFGSSPKIGHSGGADGFLAGLSKAGSLLFTTFAGNADTQVFNGLCKSAAGNILAVGYTASDISSLGSATAGISDYKSGNDYFLAEYDSGGNLLTYSVFGTSEDDKAFRCTADSSQVYIGGENGAAPASHSMVSKPPLKPHSAANDDQSDVHLFSLNSSLNILNWHTYLGLDNLADSITGIAVNSGQLMVAATLQSTGTCSDLNGSTVSSESGYSCHGLKDMALAEYKSDGSAVSTRFYGSSGQDNAVSLVKTADDGWVFAGTSSTAVSAFDGAGPLQSYSGATDLLIFRLLSDGSL